MMTSVHVVIKQSVGRSDRMPTGLIILIITTTIINAVLLFVYRDTARKLKRSNYVLEIVLEMLTKELITTEHEYRNE